MKYDAAKGAPEVVAKGAGAIAASDPDPGARSTGSRSSTSRSLTRTLYKACEIGQLIPADLYEAVAQLLAFVFGLRAKGRADGYHELPRPVLLVTPEAPRRSDPQHRALRSPA